MTAMKIRNIPPTCAAPLHLFLNTTLMLFAVVALYGQEAVNTPSYSNDPIVYLDSTDGMEAPVLQTAAPLRAKRNSQPHFSLAAPYASLQDYMKKAMRFPDEERIRCTSGLVKVQFDILPSGDIANIAVISSPSLAFSEEALRMVAEMPQWEPAYRDGVPVKVRQQLHIQFSLR